MISKKVNYLGLGLLVGCVLVFSSCDDEINPSATITTEEITVGDFSTIQVSSGFDVEIFEAEGDNEYVLIESNENLHQYIEANQENGNLSIRLDNVNVSGRTILKARVYTNHPIKAISLTGGSRLTASGVTYESAVTFDLSGASFLRTEVSTASLTANLAGASNLEIRGEANSIVLNLTGASRVSDDRMEVNMANLTLSGASQAKLVINQELRLNATGASVLRYGGDAVIKAIDMSGNSTIEKI
ncbi:DUF2807 domain-containing protein [Reichenbachiella agarivorans]|uniref:DUF2807 domain-containing protein n=1 Tax=Reichenbachiella agarivorans TaxID=2979464 RepID=A0ABY6CRP9_9BACT|nr:DUF2807 domain-containing protein [Reichenbachiella agarivorans]UXP33201.1 DUF2807 domain-containing protein [Reichenbachiella agarivorans]